MKKTKLTRSLLAAVSIVALTAVMYGCTGDDGVPQTTHDQVVDDKDDAEKQVAELTAAINALRAQLGLEADDDLGDSITELQAELKRLQDEIDNRDKDKADADYKADQAKLKKLATGIGPVHATDTTTLAAHFRSVMSHGDFAASTNKALKAEAQVDPHAISGWNGSSFSQLTAAGSRDEATVASYNNKEPDKSVMFAEWFASTVATNQTANADGEYTLVAAVHGKHISIAGLPTHPTHDALPVGETSGERGTFNGLPGRFKGSGGAVNIVASTDNDVPTWTTGTLTFKPDDPNAMVRQEDQSFMSLGWWLTETASDGSLTATVAAYGNSYDSSSAGRGDALVGKATFEGIAVGKYTHKTVNALTGGHFNADAELVADFEDTGAGTLTGTIDNFRQDGESIGDGWKVTLKNGNADSTTDNIVFTQANHVAVVADSATGTFGEHETDGTWQARFVGDERNDNMPAGVVGEFHIGAIGDPINMVGAFAASNTEDDQVDRK